MGGYQERAEQPLFHSSLHGEELGRQPGLGWIRCVCWLTAGTVKSMVEGHLWINCVGPVLVGIYWVDSLTLSCTFKFLHVSVTQGSPNYDARAASGPPQHFVPHTLLQSQLLGEDKLFIGVIISSVHFWTSTALQLFQLFKYSALFKLDFSTVLAVTKDF